MNTLPDELLAEIGRHLVYLRNWTITCNYLGLPGDQLHRMILTLEYPTLIKPNIRLILYRKWKNILDMIISIDYKAGLGSELYSELTDDMINMDLHEIQSLAISKVKPNLAELCHVYNKKSMKEYMLYYTTLYDHHQAPGQYSDLVLLFLDKYKKFDRFILEFVANTCRDDIIYMVWNMLTVPNDKSTLSHYASKHGYNLA